MNVEYIHWLAKNDVPLDPFFGGYCMMGISFNQLMKNPLAYRTAPSREKAVSQFAFAIPSEEALAAIAAVGPILEVGAGTGYWAYELRQRGVDVIAIDPKVYSDNNVVPAKVWTEVLQMDANRAIMEFGVGRSLFFCWPSYTDIWTSNALKQYDGKTVIYIGEGKGGCTANNEFHTILDEKFKETVDIKIPQWAGIHDRLYIFERNGS